MIDRVFGCLRAPMQRFGPAPPAVSEISCEGNIGQRSVTRPAHALRLAALVVVAVAAGCGGDGSALDPQSQASSDIAQLWWVMFVGSVVVFAVVLTLVLVAVLRRRGGVGEKPDRSPRRLWPVAVGGIAAPGIAAVALFAATLGTLPTTSPAGTTGLTVEVTGRQWFWDVDYPGSGVRTANEVHIPVGVPVLLRVTSADVVHSFWVPQLNRKIDMFPGETNEIQLQADRAGVYRGRCAEFCGVQHAGMGILVVAEPRARFDGWLEGQRRPATAPRTLAESRGQQVLLGSACVYCHRIAGTNASGTLGPDLTHLASRQSIAAVVLSNTPGYLAGWVLDPQHWKPGNRMPATDLSGTDLQDLLAYLESLE
jgi:cytochrome c oxidase subunit 2